MSEPLLRPAKLHTRNEVLARPCPVPAAPGVYGWYFDESLGATPTANTHTIGGWSLLYVGISPKAPSRDGLRSSMQTLRSRIRSHFRGNAAGSTLRLSLGSLLAADLGIGLRVVGSGNRLTFSSGEAVLSEWMQAHARVCWLGVDVPWTVETQLIGTLNLPLNLDQNTKSEFRSTLSAARATQRAQARTLPPLRG
jgi:hypothetical protein